jgi:hypothetical protein
MRHEVFMDTLRGLLEKLTDFVILLEKFMGLNFSSSRFALNVGKAEFSISGAGAVNVFPPESLCLRSVVLPIFSSPWNTGELIQ